MFKPPPLDEVIEKLRELAETSPLRDFERNAKLLLGSFFERLDLITRDEFEALRESVQLLRQEVVRLHERVAALEGEERGEERG
ncbi:MAG: accessory factor UbiK family protein [Hydrogenophilus sp.]|nr:accessory factor UbiK family protein [Hydrogenophilus sp.]